MSTHTYTVAGMACDHCADAITDEVTEIDGVTGVRVDVDAATIAVDATRDLDVAEIRTAVTEAGYELAE